LTPPLSGAKTEEEKRVLGAGESGWVLKRIDTLRSVGVLNTFNFKINNLNELNFIRIN